jgi:predicted ATPase/transcriptional regulator with XRE-family HTH domain
LLPSEKITINQRPNYTIYDFPIGHAYRDKNRDKMTAAKTSATFGAWVRTRRKQLDLTQSELGKRAGCSEAAIRKIEADERKPSRQLAELLAPALEIPAAEKESFLQFSRGVLIDEIRSATKTNLHNLPTLLTSTVDRTRDLANVSTLLKDKTVHLVTLIGPPGIGKTRLSIHCGNAALADFPDGVWFVDLADVTNADFFIPAIARFIPTLSLPLSPSLSQLLSRLKDKTLLLILDNFEQIVEGASLDAAQILKTCPNIKILVTSRIPLHIYGENEYPLPPLSIPPQDAKKTQAALLQFESVQLFIARTRQHQPKFAITSENANSIIEICSILEGIPLALELAAATLRQMTLAEMVNVLRGKDWVKQLATPARDLPLRQRTLENVIDWSYTLLDDEQKEFFCKLGVLSGWFDAEAVSVICEMSSSRSSELLMALTDHSLLEREIIKGKAHWHMLELIHKYAASKLSAEQLSRVEHLRVDYFLKKIQELKQNTAREMQTEYFQINFSNFHGALNWTIAEQQIELGFQLASELEGAWSALGYFKEGLSLIRQLLALPSDAEPRVRANRLQTASDLAWQLHDFESALTYSEEAVELGRVHGLKSEYPWFLNRLGRICIEQGKLAEAKDHLSKALELANANTSALNPGSPLAQLGEVALFEGNLEEAKALFEKALTQLANGDDIFLAIARTDLAEVALIEGDFPKARFWLVQAFVPASQQVRRTMIFLSALAGYLVLSPAENIKKAAQFYGAIEAWSERSGVILGSFYQELNRTRIDLARNKLSAKEWLGAFETGRGWERGETVQQAQMELVL